MIDPAFGDFHRLFGLSFKNVGNGPTINLFVMYYMPFVEIKDFNALIITMQKFQGSDWSNGVQLNC